ncbi:MAG: DUF2508 family protein [Lachnospiraceae bacterium]|nr:DUF2508 family protein [Lachnospiraceae bacterium]
MRIGYYETKYRFTSDKPVNDREIREEMRKALIALECAYSGFNYSTDPDMIDCYIYRIDSALKRYRHLLLKAEKLYADAEEIQTPPSREEHLIPAGGAAV